MIFKRPLTPLFSAPFIATVFARWYFASHDCHKIHLTIAALSDTCSSFLNSSEATPDAPFTRQALRLFWRMVAEPQGLSPVAISGKDRCLPRRMAYRTRLTSPVNQYNTVRLGFFRSKAFSFSLAPDATVTYYEPWRERK